MKYRLIADTHFYHQKLIDVGVRPPNFTELIFRNWRATVQPEDIVIHLGDFTASNKDRMKALEEFRTLPGHKWLIPGNHDRDKPPMWWIRNGFEFAAESFTLNGVLFTHEPANAIIRANGNLPYDTLLVEGKPELPGEAKVNVHGHLHAMWDGTLTAERFERDKAMLGFDPYKKLKHPWQRLLAVEYTDYRPVELNDFLAHPEKYQATGPRKR